MLFSDPARSTKLILPTNAEEENVEDEYVYNVTEGNIPLCAVVSNLVILKDSNACDREEA